MADDPKTQHSCKFDMTDSKVCTHIYRSVA